MNSRWSRYGAHQEPDVELVDVLMRDAQELAIGRMVLGRLCFVRFEDRKFIQESLSSAARHGSQSFPLHDSFFFLVWDHGGNFPIRWPSPPIPSRGRFAAHFQRGSFMPTRSRPSKSAGMDAMALFAFNGWFNFHRGRSISVGTLVSDSS